MARRRDSLADLSAELKNAADEADAARRRYGENSRRHRTALAAVRYFQRRVDSVEADEARRAEQAKVMDPIALAEQISLLGLR